MTDDVRQHAHERLRSYLSLALFLLCPALFYALFLSDWLKAEERSAWLGVERVRALASALFLRLGDPSPSVVWQWTAYALLGLSAMAIPALWILNHREGSYLLPEPRLTWCLRAMRLMGVTFVALSVLLFSLAQLALAYYGRRGDQLSSQSHLALCLHLKHPAVGPAALHRFSSPATSAPSMSRPRWPLTGSAPRRAEPTPRRRLLGSARSR